MAAGEQSPKVWLNDVGELDLFATADPFGATEGTVFHSLWDNDGTDHFTDISTGPAPAGVRSFWRVTDGRKPPGFTCI